MICKGARVVEFSGVTCSGKSKLFNEVLRLVEKNKVKAYSISENSASSHPRLPSYVCNIDKHCVKTDVYLMKDVAKFLLLNPVFFLQSLYSILILHETILNKVSIFRSFWRKCGIWQLLKNKRHSGEIFFVDEGLFHSWHNIFVSVQSRVSRKNVKKFCRKIPFPDCLIFVRADKSLLLQRMMVRSDATPRARLKEDKEKFLHNANSVHQVVCLEIRGRKGVVSVDGAVNLPGDVILDIYDVLNDCEDQCDQGKRTGVNIKSPKRKNITIPMAPVINFKGAVSFFRLIFKKQLGAAQDGARLVLSSDRGALSLYNLVEIYKQLAGKDSLTIFIPAYICKDFLMYLSSSISIRFYPIQKNWLPDWAKLEGMVEGGAVDLFVLVDYFGSVNDSSLADGFCRRNNALLIRDSAHLASCKGGEGPACWARIFTPYKHYPLPKMSIFSINIRKTTDYFSCCERDVVTAARRLIDQKRFLAELGKACWLFKKIISTLLQLTSLGVPNHLPYEHLDSELPESNASEYYLKRNATPSFSFNDFAWENERALLDRARNFHYLHSRLQSMQLTIHPINIDIIKTPYLYPLSGPRKVIAQLYKEMVDAGIAIQAWPDLPCKVVRNKIYVVANDLRESLLFLPIHQTLSIRQLNSMLAIISKYRVGG